MKIISSIVKITQIKKIIKVLDKKLKEKTFEERIQESREKIDLLLDMLKSHYRGDFKIKKRFLVYIVAAFLYLINPMDMIPDFLLGGFVDDLSIIGWVFTKINSEIVRYQEFKSSAKNQETTKEETPKV